MARPDGTKLGMMAALAIGAAACSPAPTAMSTGAGGAAQAGAGGAKVASTASHASSAASTSAVVEGSVGAGGAGAGGGAACSAPAGSFYAQTATKLGDLSPSSMCDYQDEVLLVVNVASV